MSSSTIDTMTLPSEALGMGSPSAEYRAQTGRIWAGGLFLAAVGLGFIVVGFLAFSGDEDGTRGLIICGIIGLLFVAFAVWQIAQAIVNRDLRVVVLEKGLARVGGGKTEVIRWDDVTSVLQAVTVHYRNGIKTGTTHVYTIALANGGKTVFNDILKNVEALGSTIQDEATRRLLPKYAETFNSGGAVTFGKLSLSKTGINNSRETIPWEQVEAINIQQGQISVRKQGKWLGWAGQSAAATPNLFVFLTLVDQIVGINQKK